MKFKIKRNKLIEGLNQISRAVSNRTTIPILTGVKITAKPDGLVLMGSNEEISIRTLISSQNPANQLEIKSSGSVVISARLFINLVKKLPGDTLSLEVEDNFQAKIVSGISSYTIDGLNADNYPHFPNVDTKKSINIPGNLLKELINQTVFAISNQESRPILTGVHLILRDAKLLAVATDSHRLSQRRIDLPGSNADYDVIIPGKSLSELSRMVNLHDNVKIQFAGQQVLFTIGQTSFYSRLIEGNYPDTSQLIPQESNTQVQFDAPYLLAAIERASLLSHASRNNVIKMDLNPEAGQVKITGNSSGVGKGHDNLKPKSISGKQLTISLNPDYLKDALRSLGPVTVNISFISPLRPFTLLPADDHKKSFVQLITPVRTF